MDLFYYFVILFLLSMVPFIDAGFAVPIAVLAGMPLLPVIIIASIGNFLSILVTIWFIYWIKNITKNRKSRTESSEPKNKEFVSKRKQRAKQLWDKYGMPGLAVFGTFTIGSHLTAFIACSFTKNRLHVTLWMTLSIVIWAVGSGLAAYFGLDLVSKIL